MKILSIDGGGMCGIIPLRIMEHLGLKASEFGIIAGTSTGGLIAIALGFGWPVHRIKEFYYELGPKIFKRSLWNRLTNPLGIRKPMYDIHRLKNILQEAWGDDPLDGGLLIPSYHLGGERPHFFKSWACTEPAWLVGCATAAAPVYFSGYSKYIDGGVVANNPTMCAIAEAVELGEKLEDLVVLSLGTGRPRMRAKANKHAGAVRWISDLTSIMLSGPVDAVDYQCKRLPLKSYQRYNLELPEGLAAMDDASEKTMKMRERFVDDWWQKKRQKLLDR